MARKIRFPLEIDRIEVRSLEELKENFSVLQVLEYLKNGKLAIWLRDRGLNDMADQIQALDTEDSNCMKKLCEILGFPQEKISKFDKIFRLRKCFADEEYEKYEKVLDQTAFDQKGLQDLLERGINKIYLCGDEFSIPLSYPGIKYIGINEPVTSIDSREKVDWTEKGISIQDTTFDADDPNFEIWIENVRKEINRRFDLMAIRAALLKFTGGFASAFADMKIKLGILMTSIDTIGEDEIKEDVYNGKIKLECLKYSIQKSLDDEFGFVCGYKFDKVGDNANPEHAYYFFITTVDGYFFFVESKIVFVEYDSVKNVKQDLNSVTIFAKEAK